MKIYMAKLRANSMARNGIIKLKIVAKRLLMGKKCDEEGGVSVPKDVKEGHFAVVAVEGEEPKRFVVPLSCLSHPNFLELLEMAAEEYGFDHQGALPIPCSPTHLERLLADDQWDFQPRS